MKRRLGASGIFVEVDGKYYLGESRLKQVGEGTNRKMGAGGRYNTRKRMLELRIARMILGVVVVALVLYDLLYVGGATLRYLIIVLLFVWVVLTLSQLYWLSRVRHRMVSGA